MVVGNHQCNAANLNQSKPQFQLELSLAQFSPSLLNTFSDKWQLILRGKMLQSRECSGRVCSKLNGAVHGILIKNNNSCLKQCQLNFC